MVSSQLTYPAQPHMEGSVFRLEEVDIGKQSYFMDSLARPGGVMARVLPTSPLRWGFPRWQVCYPTTDWPFGFPEVPW